MLSDDEMVYNPEDEIGKKIYQIINDKEYKEDKKPQSRTPFKQFEPEYIDLLKTDSHFSNNINNSGSEHTIDFDDIMKKLTRGQF